MRVLFVIPWMKSLFGDEHVAPGHPHIGIAYLTAVLKKNGHDVRIFDQGIENDDSKLDFLIKNFKPQIIGLSAFSYCYKYVFKLINDLKRDYKIPLVIGGPHVSAVKKDVLLKTNADYAIKGESEESFLNFINNINGDLSKVNGLIWRDGKKIVENADHLLIHDLDSIPFPDFDAFDFEKYIYYKTKTIPIITSRGCPYGCNYCSVRLSMGCGFRARSPENVVSELEYWYSRDFTNFEFNDDCFSLDIERAKNICRLIIKKHLKIKWQLYNGIRVDRVDDKLLYLMKKSGCIFVSYGCESGDESIIKNIGKNIKLSQVRKAVELTNKVGIKNSVNFIIGHPGETYETAMRSIKFAKSLPTGFVNFYNLIPYPGTTLFDWINKNGKWFYSQDYILENVGSRDLDPVFETKEFNRADRIKALKKGFNLYEQTVIQFRFGKKIGLLAYHISRLPFIFKFARYFALSNKLGNRIYNLLTGGSRK